MTDICKLALARFIPLTLVLTSGRTHDAAWRAPPPFLFPELSLDEAGPLARVAPSLCLLEISPQNSPRSCPPNLFSRDNCLACRLSILADGPRAQIEVSERGSRGQRRFEMELAGIVRGRRERHNESGSG
jgi:hypothetical protein